MKTNIYTIILYVNSKCPNTVRIIILCGMVNNKRQRSESEYDT